MKAYIIAKKATAFVTAVAPLLPPPDGAAAAPPPQIPTRKAGRGGRKAFFVKAINLPCAGHHCLPGGRERRATTIRVHPPPRCPPPPPRLAKGY